MLQFIPGKASESYLNRTGFTTQFETVLLRAVASKRNSFRTFALRINYALLEDYFFAAPAGSNFCDGEILIGVA